MQKNYRFLPVRTEEEFAGVKELTLQVFDENVKTLLDDLFIRSPYKDENICFYAFDESENKYVGTLSFIDVKFRFEGIPLKVAEYGVAATDVNYRNQRINSRLTEMFFEHCKQSGYNIVVLEGIPYFYRRYGFEYTVPMKREILDLKDKQFNKPSSIKISKAKPEDADFIVAKHQEEIEKLDIVKYKDRAIIEAQIGSFLSEVTQKEYYIVEKDSKKEGYFALNMCNEVIELCDVSKGLSFEACEAILAYLQKELAPLKEEGVLHADLFEENKFVKYLRTKGSKQIGSYAWQIKIIDDYKFFQDILPVLEKRVQNSIYQNEKIEFYYNNFKKLIHFTIDRGKITLREESWEPKWDVNLTPEGAVRLFFGHNSLDEITEFLPDCMVNSKYRDIIEVLFPKVKVKFFMNY